MRRYIATGAVLCSAAFWACQEVTPTAPGDELIPLNPQTVEVLIAFEDFVEKVQIIGGFGSPSQLGRGVVAHDFEGLNSKTILRFGRYPSTVTVRDTVGVTRPDSSVTFISGTVVLFFDTVRGTLDEPVELQASFPPQPWHAPTVTWDVAVDTIGDRTLWSEPGGGGGVLLGTATFDPQVSDSVTFALDSAQVAAWADTTDASRGMLLSVEGSGKRINLNLARLRLLARPSINPDTLVVATAFVGDISFIFDPFPEPPSDGLRVGGAPAWRTILTLDPPRTIEEPHALCAVLTCPFEVTAERVNQAELILTTRETPLAFQPADTTGLDVRPVLNPELLPKAPLGNQLAGLLGRPMPPSYFAEEAGSLLKVPLTGFIQEFYAGETSLGTPAATTLALLALFEPVSLGFASFDGPGSPGAPVLRLLLTISGRVSFP